MSLLDGKTGLIITKTLTDRIDEEGGTISWDKVSKVGAEASDVSARPDTWVPEISEIPDLEDTLDEKDDIVDAIARLDEVAKDIPVTLNNDNAQAFINSNARSLQGISPVSGSFFTETSKDGYKKQEAFGVWPATENDALHPEDVGSYGRIQNCTVTDNVLPSPVDGQMTADLVVPNTTNAVHYVRDSLTHIPDGTYTMSIHMKAAGYYRVRMDPLVKDALTQAYVNLYTGEIDPYFGMLGDVIFEELEDGWFRFTFTFEVIDGVFDHFFYAYILDDNGNVTYAGDGTSGIYIANFIIAEARGEVPYHTSTRAVGKISYSDDFFNDSPWLISGFIRPTDKLNTVYDAVVFGSFGTTDYGFALKVLAPGRSGYTNGTFRIITRDSVNGEQSAYSVLTPTFNDWQMVTLVWTGTELQLYKDTTKETNANDKWNGERSGDFGFGTLTETGELGDDVLSGYFSKFVYIPLSLNITQSEITAIVERLYKSNVPYRWIPSTAFKYEVEEGNEQTLQDAKDEMDDRDLTTSGFIGTVTTAAVIGTTSVSDVEDGTDRALLGLTAAGVVDQDVPEAKIPNLSQTKIINLVSDLAGKMDTDMDNIDDNATRPMDTTKIIDKDDALNPVNFSSMGNYIFIDDTDGPFTITFDSNCSVANLDGKQFTFIRTNNTGGNITLDAYSTDQFKYDGGQNTYVMAGSGHVTIRAVTGYGWVIIGSGDL